MKKTIMIKTIVACASLVLPAAELFGQSLVGNSLYTQNPSGINPSYFGADGNIKAALQVRNKNMVDYGRYTGSQLLIHGKANKKIGVGLKVGTATQNKFQEVEVALGSSYKVSLTESSSLNFAVSAGFVNGRTNRAAIAYNSFVDLNDPTINTDMVSASGARVGASVMYQMKGLEASVNLPILLDESPFAKETFNAMLLYKFKNISGGDISLMPSVLIRKFDATKLQVDASMNMEWKEKFWLQLGYRNNGNFLAGIGFKLEDFNLAYVFNLTNGKYADVARNAHEIGVGFVIGKNKGSTD